MKLIIVLMFLYCAINVQSFVEIRGKVKKRNTVVVRKTVNASECALKETITNDYEILLSVVSEAKYVFTGRILNVKKIKRNDGRARKVYQLFKVYIRQVLKGVIDDLKKYVTFGQHRTLNSGVVILELLLENRCGFRFKRRSSAIFLSDDVYRMTNHKKMKLRLLKEPVVLTNLSFDKVRESLKGKNFHLLLQDFG